MKNNVFSFKRVSAEKKNQVCSWLEEIKEYLNTNPLIEDWLVKLSSGFAGYGTGRHRFDGTQESGELVIYTRKNGHLMDVCIPLFSNTEDIQRLIEIGIEERTKNYTGTYWTGGPYKQWVYNSEISKANPNSWKEYSQDEWILRNKLVRKLRKYINKNKIDIPEYVSWFDTNWNDSIGLMVSIINPEVLDFNNKLNEVGFNTYVTYATY